MERKLNEQGILFSDVLATRNGPRALDLPPHLQDGQRMIYVQHNNLSHTDIDSSIETSEIPQNVTETGPIELSKRIDENFSACIRHKKSKKMSTAEKIAKCLERRLKLLLVRV